MGADLCILAKEAKASEQETLRDWVEVMETIDMK